MNSILSPLKRLTHLEILKRKFLLEKQPQALARLLALQETLVRHIRHRLTNSKPSLNKYPDKHLDKHSNERPNKHNAITHPKNPPSTISNSHNTNLKTQIPFIKDSSYPNHHHSLVRQAIKAWTREKELNETLLQDLRILCDKYFYTQHESYNKQGERNVSALKHYSRST